MSNPQSARVAATLTVENVSVEIAGRSIVRDISLAAEGDVVGLVGPNGSGKSTILRAVYRMLRPGAGRVVADGIDVWQSTAREAARITAAVVQDAPSELELSVAECVATGRLVHRRFLASDGPGDSRAVSDAMVAAGVAELADRDMSTLSGGERQRVQLARALAQDPRVLVLDEPTNHLDIRHQLELMSLIRSLRITTLITLHDLNLAVAYCDRVVVLAHGAVFASGEAGDVLTSATLRDVFGIRASTISNPLTGRPQLVYADGTETR